MSPKLKRAIQQYHSTTFEQVAAQMLANIYGDDYAVNYLREAVNHREGQPKQLTLSDFKE